jgi:hypothetical protein
MQNRFFDEVNVLEKFADFVKNVLKANRAVFAKDDFELFVTNTIEMTI